MNYRHIIIVSMAVVLVASPALAVVALSISVVGSYFYTGACHVVAQSLVVGLVSAVRENGDAVEVLLIGDEPGLTDVAAEAQVPLLNQVARNDSGTPLVSSIFNLARQHSHSPLLAYVNADMLFLPDFVQAAKAVVTHLEHFLVIGRRWDLNQRTLLDFSPGWEAHPAPRRLLPSSAFPPCS